MTFLVTGGRSQVITDCCQQLTPRRRPCWPKLISVQSWVESKAHGHIDEGTTIYPRLWSVQRSASEVNVKLWSAFEAVVEMHNQSCDHWVKVGVKVNGWSSPVADKIDTTSTLPSGTDYGPH